jgi:ribosomal protein S18 acetylase RimI-like enzyme
VTVTVRPARPEELTDAGELVAAAYLADGVVRPGDPYLDDLRDAAGRARDSVVLVADDGGRLVGTVTWCPGGSSHREVAADGEGEFRSLGVAPSDRGRGVGELLVRACLARAVAEGYSAIALSSAEWMGAAHRLYTRLGFRRTPERDWRPFPDVPLLAYRLDLVGGGGCLSVPRHTLES